MAHVSWELCYFVKQLNQHENMVCNLELKIPNKVHTLKHDIVAFYFMVEIVHMITSWHNKQKLISNVSIKPEVSD